MAYVSPNETHHLCCSFARSALTLRKTPTIYSNVCHAPTVYARRQVQVAVSTEIVSKQQRSLSVLCAATE